MRFIATIFIFLSGLSHALDMKDIGCIDDDACGDQCIHFGDGTIANLEEDRMKILYKKRIYSLNQTETKDIVLKQPQAEVPGDIRRKVFQSNNIKAVLVTKVISTSCYYKKNGKYQSSESCCSTEYNVDLDLFTPSGNKKLKTEWSLGC